MKFGKLLKRQIEQSLPEWRDKFVSYKELKRIVASISRSPADEAAFVAALAADIDKIDSFFLEQEEEFVIRHRARTPIRFNSFVNLDKFSDGEMGSCLLGCRSCRRR
ncbi:hypothetical protein EE612_040660 [Oryza sativa]|nr:hypothetical protein EE612_040660 [Oryza sativa]